MATTPYEQHLPLELRTGLYRWDGDVLTTWQTTHRTFDVRRELAKWLSLPEEQVRVIQTGFMGSSYGSADQIVEELVLPAVMARLIEPAGAQHAHPRGELPDLGPPRPDRRRSEDGVSRGRAL